MDKQSAIRLVPPALGVAFLAISTVLDLFFVVSSEYSGLLFGTGLILIGVGGLSFLAEKTFRSVSVGGFELELASGEVKPVTEAPPPSGLAYYRDLVRSSRALAQGLYDRSGVYLITGVTLAVGGVVAFYLLKPVPAPNRSIMDIIVLLLPGSSMLLLVELIAFFFLRQSRAMIDEFRHFDNLARNREEVLAALSIAAEGGKPLDLADLMARGFYFSRGERLLPGESTEIVETRKLEKTEIDLLNKVVDAISSTKKI